MPGGRTLSSTAATMKSSFLFLVLAVAAVSSEVVDINWLVDLGLTRINEFLRQHSHTSLHIPPGSIGSRLSYYDSEVVALDSLKRTDDCTVEVVGNNHTFEYHFGLGFLQQSFDYLKINDEEMSANYTIGDNSMHLNYTVHNIGQEAGRCFVTVHDMSFERLAKVDFHSSRPEWDGIYVDELFDEIIPWLNKKINKQDVEEVWQEWLCRRPNLMFSENIPLIHQTLLKQMGLPSLQ